ncbi:MAG: phage/plasmid primase, P4 family [Vicinamibacteria bacterium]
MTSRAPVCRDFAAGAPPRVAHLIASAQKRAAVIDLAEDDRRHAATIAQWDADPWLLGTPGGTVDLRSGELREARREDFITRCAAVVPSAMPTPHWDALLARALDGDLDLVAYLQRVAGYALTGETREHALMFLYGTGANGKSTVLNALSGVLGDYAISAPMESFVATTGDRHPTDLAMLRGARLVSASETESGRRWAESKIKALTGGDPISARFMRGDFFTYSPQFKLVLSGNHRPALRDVDEAMRRRFHLVPFTVTIPAEERDPRLPEKLRAEWPGILAWAIRGCLEWQRGGLRPPDRVRAATDSYLAAEDTLARWLEESCHVGRDHEDTGARLFGSWQAWCEAGEEHVGSKKRFSQRLEERGFAAGWVQRVRGFNGLAVSS